MTVSDYMWRTRLQNCRHELEAYGGKTVTDVAFSWGFSSSSHFSRVFRKYFGIVPSSVHKAQQQNLSQDAAPGVQPPLNPDAGDPS
jgi:AraC-like DNA-binding protein